MLLSTCIRRRDCFQVRIWWSGKLSIDLLMELICFCSINVAMANFLDSLIDYPNSKMYVFGVFEKMQTLKLFNEKQVKNYTQHVENLEKFD